MEGDQEGIFQLQEKLVNKQFQKRAEVFFPRQRKLYPRKQLNLKRTHIGNWNERVFEDRKGTFDIRKCMSIWMK